VKLSDRYTSAIQWTTGNLLTPNLKVNSYSIECKRIQRTVCDNCRQPWKSITIDCMEIRVGIVRLIAKWSETFVEQ